MAPSATSQIKTNNDIAPSPFRHAGTFGIRITSADKDKLVGEIDVDHRHLNKGGIVHGGALLAFADDLGGPSRD
jgi:acyl-coenzyme A thioesterase PaaI-like protein